MIQIGKLCLMVKFGKMFKFGEMFKFGAIMVNIILGGRGKGQGAVFCLERGKGKLFVVVFLHICYM